MCEIRDIVPQRKETKMKPDNEILLEYWLRISTAVNNERVVSEMPYNEALICNLLYRNQKEHPEQRLTATDLCKMTRILKSQMNRTIRNMEQKGLIQRERSTQDRRQIFLQLNPEQTELYERQHQKSLTLIDRLLEQAGRERAEEIIRLFGVVAEIAEKEL